MKRYIITLPDEKAATLRQVTLFILLINLVVFLLIYLNAPDVHVQAITFAGAVICFFSLLLFLIKNFTKKMSSFRVEISFILLSVFWFFLERYLLGLSILCFAIAGIYSRRRPDIIFSTDHIIYPSFPKKLFFWKDVSNVILKDNMLTLDLKNNKLIQVVIDKESALSINEAEFNLFCKDCLSQ